MNLKTTRVPVARKLVGLGAAAALGFGAMAFAAPANATELDAKAPAIDLSLAAEQQAPPADDPAAVAEYLKLLQAYRQSDTAARSTASSGPCLSSANVSTVAEGARVSVYRKTDAPYLVCVNAAQAVYDNEYKSMVSSTYHGNKYRDQLVCHVANAWDKRPWNIDSWRPDVGYPATVAAGCNPN